MSIQDMTPDSWDAMEGVTPPQQTLQVLGHDDAFRALVDQYRAGRLHHAWLVNGLRGIGKASFAYRFAEFLLRYPDPAAAPETFSTEDDPIHSQVAKGAHPNVVALQRPWDQKAKKFKTRITVEEVRRAASFLQTASGTNAWRIIIIDPADDMNASAANALLKILEEPPARTLFFVLAHSPRGLLPTIRSRCQILPLKPLSDADLKTVLSWQERMEGLDADAVNRLVARAGGSARKALELASGEVLETFEAFLDLTTVGGEDIGKLHQLVGKLSPAAKSADYGLFCDLVGEHMSARLRDQVANDQVSLGQVNQLVRVMESFQQANQRVEIWNMDKKQVILNLYRDMRSV